MRTTFRVKQPYADWFLECAEGYQLHTPVRPRHFMEMMRKNRGTVGVISGFGLDENGLERKNPVIVALGDSVTAGHFESLLAFLTQEQLQEMFASPDEVRKSGRGNLPIEVTDSRECYLERFRMKLIDKYEETSVSTINAGIAGDNLIQMQARLDRDVIRYQPDLVLINGSLNWDAAMGDASEYKRILREMVLRIKNETSADIVLLTPNGDLPNPMFGGQEPTTPERVKVIRELAFEEQVCLADVYAIWVEMKQRGCPWEELLSNGQNHPSVEGHEVYAITLMKLFEE